MEDPLDKLPVWLSDTPVPFNHSTPVKKELAVEMLIGSQSSVTSSISMERSDKHWEKMTPLGPPDSQAPPSFLDPEFPLSDPSSSTIQKQRRELQLLMTELKDRDRELNTMTEAHQRQLQAWERGRQKVLSLEQKCARQDDELQKRNEVIRVLMKRVRIVETREKEVQRELGAAQQQLYEVQQNQQHIRKKCQDYEEKNQSLNSTVTILSNQVGSLHVREEELSAMLKLKDKDVSKASSQIINLSGRLRDLETSLNESRSQDSKLLKDVEENKHRYQEARQEVLRLKEELQQQVTQSSSQREEIIRLKQELQLLRRDLAWSEGESWKDELLELARSKHERATSELKCLRQVCENQRNDLQLLQQNLETAREALKERSGQEVLRSHDRSGCILQDESPASVRVKNSGHKVRAAAAALQDTANTERACLATRFPDSDDPLSSSFLQQLLDESLQVVTGSYPWTSKPPGWIHYCGTTDSPHSHSCPIPHPPTKAPALQPCETPPGTYPRHDDAQPGGGLCTNDTFPGWNPRPSSDREPHPT